MNHIICTLNELPAVYTVSINRGVGDEVYN